MRKFLKLLAVVLVIVQIWTVSTQPTDGDFITTTNLTKEENNKLLGETEVKETSLSIILSEIQKIQLNTANIELKLKELTDVNELIKSKEKVADYKDQISKLHSTLISYKNTINANNKKISKLESANDEYNIKFNTLKYEFEKLNSETERLKNEQKENQEQMVRKSFIEMELERCKEDSYQDKRKFERFKEKTQSTLQTEVKYCNSWKELFKNKLSSKDDELIDCYTKNQQISGSSIPSKILPTSCLNLTSGIQEIQLPNGNPYYVLCGSDGWLIIQRRIDGSQDFNKTWQEYVDGVGDIHGEFFMGLENLHLITNATRQQLNISIRTDDFGTEVAEYDDFRIGNSESLYELESIGNFTEDEYTCIINALQHHIKRPFSTYDRKSPDLKTGGVNFGGWWYSNVDDYCYLNAPHTDAGYSKVYWRYVGVQAVTMAIRPYIHEH